MKNKKAYPISIQQLKRIDGQQYRPDIPYKYFEENGIWYENTHVPSELMMLTGQPTQEPSTILDLISHLVNHDIDKFEFVINWLAKSYAYGKKPETAIILFGDEGSGKGTLNTIMTQLYGEHNCSQLNAHSFKDKHNIVNEITNKRFINIDEVSMKLSEKNEEFFKGIIGNPSITLKGKIDIHFQCILTANYSTVFKIPEKGRRFTVIKTADSLESTNFLGFGSYDAFIMQVHKELEDFSKYIKSYDVDFKLADNPLDTEEKTEIINKSKNYLKYFHKDIIELKIDSFSIMARKDDHYKEIFEKMEHDFIRHRRVNRSHLKVAWEALYGDELSTVSIMNILKEYHYKAGFKDYIFSSEKIAPIGGEHYIYPKGRY